jgi:hypothetical protein
VRLLDFAGQIHLWHPFAVSTKYFLTRSRRLIPRIRRISDQNTVQESRVFAGGIGRLPMPNIEQKSMSDNSQKVKNKTALCHFGVFRQHVDNTMFNPFYSRSFRVLICHRADQDATDCPVWSSGTARRRPILPFNRLNRRQKNGRTRVLIESTSSQQAVLG